MIKPSTDLVMYEKYDEKTEENESGEEFKIPHWKRDMTPVIHLLLYLDCISLWYCAQSILKTNEISIMAPFPKLKWAVILK